jgi:hypothetical protein
MRVAVFVGLGLGLGCSGITTPNVPDEPPPTVVPLVESVGEAALETQLIVLAGNYLSNGACGKEDGSGCDLYAVWFNPAAQTVTAVERLTDTPGLMEHFPSVDRHQQMVAYTESLNPREVQLKAVSMESGQSILLAQDGRYPSFSPTHDGLAYSTRDRSVMIGQFTGGGVSGASRIAQGRDPQFSPNGKKLTFHVRPEGGKTQTAVFAVDTGQQTLLPGVSGCAHATFSQDGGDVLCGERAKLYRHAHTEGDWGSAVEVPRPTEPARFAGCDFTSHAFPDFCPDGNTAVVSVGCHERRDTRYTQVLLIDLSRNTFVDLHGQIEAHLGVSGKESRSADCAG